MTPLEIVIWTAVIAGGGGDLTLGIVWLHATWREHGNSCERCYRRRHPEQHSRESDPAPPAVPQPLVDATARETVAATSPQRRVEQTPPDPGASAPRPRAGTPSPAHTVEAGPVWRPMSGPASTTVGASRG